MTAHVRDQVVEAVREAVSAIPGFTGRVYREGAVDWDERTYPVAIVFSGASSVDQISDVDGYRLERRTTQISVAIAVREYAGETVTDALSELTAIVEDEIVGLENQTWVEGIDVRELSPVVQSDDDDGGIAANVLTVVVEYYTQHGQSAMFVTAN